MEKKGRLNSFAELVYELFVTGLAANISSFQNDSVCKFTRDDIKNAHYEFKANPDGINQEVKQRYYMGYRDDTTDLDARYKNFVDKLSIKDLSTDEINEMRYDLN